MTDTSPAALRKLADEALCNTAFVPKSLLLAIAAEKEAQQPVADVPMTDQEIEVAAKKAGGRWDGSAWVFEDADLHPFARTLLASQHHSEQPLNMVATADVPLPEPDLASEFTYDAHVYGRDKLYQYAEAYAAAAVAAERERCAALCLRPLGWLSVSQQNLATEIRNAIQKGTT